MSNGYGRGVRATCRICGQITRVYGADPACPEHFKWSMHSGLYAVEFSGDLYKVGRAKNIDRRLAQHQAAGWVFRAPALRTYAVGVCHHCDRDSEQTLIELAHEDSTERRSTEWFGGCSWTQLVDTLDDLNRACVTVGHRVLGWDAGRSGSY
jgi:hypothetical protein